MEKILNRNNILTENIYCLSSLKTDTNFKFPLKNINVENSMVYNKILRVYSKNKLYNILHKCEGFINKIKLKDINTKNIKNIRFFKYYMLFEKSNILYKYWKISDNNIHININTGIPALKIKNSYRAPYLEILPWHLTDNIIVMSLINNWPEIFPNKYEDLTIKYMLNSILKNGDFESFIDIWDYYSTIKINYSLSLLKLKNILKKHNDFENIDVNLLIKNINILYLKSS